MSNVFTQGEAPKLPGYVDSKKYNAVVKKLREFFWGKGFIEVHTQSRLSILASCENPQSITVFNYRSLKWPNIQTGQMILEYELLTDPSPPGYFCMTTSYRSEQNPIPGRHDHIFPLFEIEMPGKMTDLLDLWRELLKFLGYNETPVELQYDDMTEKYGVETIEHTQEQQMYKEYGPVVFLENFPISSSPFWNMCLDESRTHAKKVDVLLSGIETFGSAERSSDVKEMRRQFDTISDGAYAKILYDEFGQDRVDAEMNDYLNLPMTDRVGGGIGITRLIRSLEMEGLLDWML